MFSVFRTLSLRYLSRRWFRALLIVASIALGVATLVATQALNRTMSKAALTAANPLAGFADLIVSNDDLPLSSSLVADIKSVDGVLSARALLTGKVSLSGPPEEGKKEREVLVLGLDLPAEATQPTLASTVTLLPSDKEVFGWYLYYTDLKEFIPDDLFEGILNLFPKPPSEKEGKKTRAKRYPVIMGKLLAQDLGILDGDRIDAEKQEIKVTNRSRVRVGAEKERDHTLIVIGAMDASGDSSPLAGPVMVMDLKAAQKVLDYPPGQVQRIDVLLKEGVDAQEVRTAVERKVAKRALVRTPQEQNESIQAVMRGMQVGFSLCGVAALVVGMFLVYNALSVSVAERRHEIGILLSLGATRLQVWRLFAAEAALLGLIGSLLGIPLGYGLANLGLGPMQEILQEIFYSLETRGVDVPYSLMALGLGIGMATAVAAALVPAYQASRETPAEAVRRVLKAPSARRLALQAGISVLFIVTGMLIILLRDYFPRRWGMYGGLILVLIGALASAPFIAAIVARIVQPPVRRFLGIEWRLAADNIVRSPGRTGLVIGALAAGVALVVQTAGVILSNQVAINDWVEESIGADIVITSGGLVAAGGNLRPMDPLLAERVRDIDRNAIQAVLPVRMLKVPFENTRITVLAVEADRAHQLEKTRLSNGHAQLYPLLLANPGSVIASNNFVAIHGFQVGDTISLPGPNGLVGLKIVGTIDDYTWNHGTLIMDRQVYLKHWQDDQVDVFDVYLKDTAGARKGPKEEDPATEVKRLQVKKAIADGLGASYDLRILTRPELQGRIRRMIEQIYGIAYGQQMVVMIVAALGVVTSLLISVLQRRREMGLLRAIGASRGQVVRSVLCEACLMGLIGTGIGLLVGLPLQWYVLKVIILDESGFLFPMYIPWKEALFISLGSMLTATLAGLGPALHAVRQRIPDAIAYE